VNTTHPALTPNHPRVRIPAEDRLALVETHVVAAVKLLEVALGWGPPARRDRTRITRAVEQLDELLELPDRRPVAWETEHVAALDAPLRAIRAILVAGDPLTAVRMVLADHERGWPSVRSRVQGMRCAGSHRWPPDQATPDDLARPLASHGLIQRQPVAVAAAATERVAGDGGARVVADVETRHASTLEHPFDRGQREPRPTVGVRTTLRRAGDRSSATAV
jgi:hypothetical protein